MSKEWLQRLIRFFLIIGEYMAEKWIQSAIKPSNRGKLRKELNTPVGKNISKKKLDNAAKAPGKLGERARFAKTLKRIRNQ